MRGARIGETGSLKSHAQAATQTARVTTAATVHRFHGLTADPPAIEESRAATMAAEGRRSGSLASIALNKEPSGSPTLLEVPFNHSGSDVWIANEVRAAVSCRNGWQPVAISVSTTPRAKTSLAPVGGLPSICSGDIYPKVPIGIPARSSRVPIWAATPKSRTLR